MHFTFVVTHNDYHHDSLSCLMRDDIPSFHVWWSSSQQIYIDNILNTIFMIFFFAQHVHFVTSLGLHLIAPSEYTCITILARLELPFFFLPSSLYPTNSKKNLPIFFNLLAFSLLLLCIHKTYIYVHGFMSFLRRSFFFFVTFFHSWACVVSYLASFFRYITLHTWCISSSFTGRKTTPPLHFHSIKEKLDYSKRKKKSLKNTIPCFTLHSLQTQLSYFFLLSKHISFQCFFFCFL